MSFLSGSHCPGGDLGIPAVTASLLCIPTLPCAPTPPPTMCQGLAVSEGLTTALQLCSAPFLLLFVLSRGTPFALLISAFTRRVLGHIPVCAPCGSRVVQVRTLYFLILCFSRARGQGCGDLFQKLVLALSAWREAREISWACVKIILA